MFNRKIAAGMIGVLGIIAYGPLEVFFFIWLVQNTEKTLSSVLLMKRKE